MERTNIPTKKPRSDQIPRAEIVMKVLDFVKMCYKDRGSIRLLQPFRTKVNLMKYGLILSHYDAKI